MKLGIKKNISLKKIKVLKENNTKSNTKGLVVTLTTQDTYMHHTDIYTEMASSNENPFSRTEDFQTVPLALLKSFKIDQDTEV